MKTITDLQKYHDELVTMNKELLEEMAGGQVVLEE